MPEATPLAQHIAKTIDDRLYELIYDELELAYDESTHPLHQLSHDYYAMPGDRQLEYAETALTALKLELKSMF